MDKTLPASYSISMNNKVLLSDLAWEANCSVAQASRAINGKPFVAPEIRERVRAAALKLNYRNTAHRHVPNIAILKHWPMGFFSSAVITAVEEALHEQNWTWQIVDVENIENIREFFHDGIISVTSTDHIIKQATWLMNFPLITINFYGNAMENICSIDPDSNEEARLVLEHLTGLGHRRIARIKYTLQEYSERYQHRGDNEFLAMAKLFGIDHEVGNFLYYDDCNLDDVVSRVIAAGYTAIFMIHQRLAVAIASSLQRLGIRVPEEISLITYEISGVTEYLHPPHTTLDFNYVELARMTVKQLKRRMKGETVPVKFNCPVKFTIRESTGPCRR